MQYHNNILCVSGSQLIATDLNPKGIVSYDNYKKLCQRNHIKVVRRACKGNEALIEFASLPLKYQEMITARYGNPAEQAAARPFKDKITPDANAITFYSNYMLADGRNLPETAQREYAMNAAVLNAIKEIKEARSTARKKLGASTKGFWSKALIAVNDVRLEFNHSLPSKEKPLERKYRKYILEGYEGLISGKYCNDNSRKVTADIERLLLSLYTMPNKPFGADIHSLYHQFIMGKIQVVDKKTGEYFNAQDFIRNGVPVEICERTVLNYLNQPNNRIIVDKVRSGAHRFNTTHRPHHHRSAPEYSFSKITMDDRDLPRKCVNGKRVKAYYSYDVASGCVIGYAYSFDKDEALFIDCMQNTFRLIEKEGFGMPLEVEVENHLVKKFFDDLAIMFPFVRICNPGNSQEKHAEHFNRQKKYGVEKKTQQGIGRWYARHEAYRIDQDKVNDEFVEKAYDYDRLVADDLEAIKQYNNQLHPKQKRYPGKTRWQVLTENMNPNAPQVSKAVVYKAIGDRTPTTIRRNQYVTVKYGKYQISSIHILDRLEPNNYEVVAYYLPDGEGMISEVYLYQGQTFLCKADKIQEYNTAKAEWTDADHEAYTIQAKFVSEFDAHAKRGKHNLATPLIIESEKMEQAIEHPVILMEAQPEPETNPDDLIYSFDEEAAIRRAEENL